MRLASGLRASSPMLVSASTSTSFSQLAERNHKSPEMYSDICAVGPLFATELTWITTYSVSSITEGLVSRIICRHQITVGLSRRSVSAADVEMWTFVGALVWADLMSAHR